MEGGKAMKLGFVGLGRMGGAMAANLLQVVHKLTVHNRTLAKAEPHVSKGAELARTPGEAARGEAVITMLADDAAVEAAVFSPDGILEALEPGAIHISMSTISLALAERLTKAHGDRGQRFVSAPVFGRPDAAAAGKLFIVAAGLPGVVAACQPAFDALGQRTFAVSEHAPHANLVKLSGKIASVIEALGEAFALIGKAGIDRAQYLDLLVSTLFGAPVYKTYGGLIADERYQPAGFRAELGYKDIGLALDAAQTLEVPMPLASLIAERFLTLIAAGGRDLDWSALALLEIPARRRPSILPAEPDAVALSAVSPDGPPEPALDCPLCPRLVAFRQDNRSAHPDWFNGAVPSFGDAGARLLIVGLAPGLKGANRTGRPFLGDYAGELLYRTLLKTGLARGQHDVATPKALELVDCMITNAVRCVPPQNKPKPDEIARCRQFLTGRMRALPNLRTLLAIGRVAHDSILDALQLKKRDFLFAHGARHALPSGLILFDSYHCSRQNTNTGRLTTPMFEKVVGAAAASVTRRA
jgi:uracil-DNA glycosylase family 4